ncbi:Endopolyphosphatase [Quaeritorhiza haematococci]|nr:Endopolyphosphatase [Quaeritorhiza haematococci]
MVRCSSPIRRRSPIGFPSAFTYLTAAVVACFVAAFSTCVLAAPLASSRRHALQGQIPLLNELPEVEGGLSIASETSSSLRAVGSNGSKLTGRFLHITDIHIDPWYQTGTTVGSSCHQYPGRDFVGQQSTPGFEATRKSGGDPDALAGEYGSPGSGCDAPLALINETFRFVKDGLDRVDFVIWTGDSARHDSDPQIPRTAAEVRDLNAMAVEYMLSAFPHPTNPQKASIPVVPNIGNNDITPHNQLAYTPDEPNPTLDFFASVWEPFIPADQVPVFRKGGYFYVEVVPDQLIVASLNTMYWFNSNRAVPDCTDSSTAGGAQLKWLEESVLKPARKRGVSVYLEGHVPPNVLNFYQQCYIWFATLATEYNDVVLAQFYGHMNIDHFFFPTINMKSSFSQQKEASTQTFAPSLSQILESTSSSSSSSSMTIPNIAASSKSVSDFFDSLHHHASTHSFSVSSLSSSPSLFPSSIQLDPSIPIPSAGPSWLNIYIQYLLNQYESLSDSDTDSDSHVKGVPSVVLVSPSVVPAYNSGLRVFEYKVKETKEEGDGPGGKRGRRRGGEDKAGTLEGYTQYYVNIARWNRVERRILGRDEFIYEVEYRFNLEYNLPSASTTSYLTLARRLVGKDDNETKDDMKALQRRWIRNMVVGLDER